MKETRHIGHSVVNVVGMPLLLAVMLGVPQPALSDTIYDERIHGDLADLDWPIQLTLGRGSNEISGWVQHPYDIFDPFGFVVPPSLQLRSLVLLELERTVAITLFAGPVPLVPNDIGGVRAQPVDVGTDLLPLMGLSPLSSGTYSARIFAAYEPERPYRLDLRLVPEPSLVLLLGVGLAASLGSRRKS